MEEAKDTRIITGVDLGSTDDLNIIVNRQIKSQDDDKDRSTKALTFPVLPDLLILSEEWNTSSSPVCLNQQRIIGKI